MLLLREAGHLYIGVKREADSSGRIDKLRQPFGDPGALPLWHSGMAVKKADEHGGSTGI